MKYYKWIEQTKDTVESVIYRCEFQIKFPGYYNVEPYTAARCNKTQNWFISHPIKCLSFREPLINIRAIMKCRPLPLLIHLLSSHHLVHVTTIQPVAYCPPSQETISGTLLSREPVKRININVHQVQCCDWIIIDNTAIDSYMSHICHPIQARRSIQGQAKGIVDLHPGKTQ